jgi:hypothetical protein
MSREDRNFGTGPKLNTRAIYILAKETREILGHSSAYKDKCVSALRDYAEYLREDWGLRDMAVATIEQYVGWVGDLRERLEDQDISASSASTYLACVNQINATHGRQDLHLNASDHGINRGIRITNTDRSMPEDVYKAVLQSLTERYAETGNSWYQDLRHSVILQHDCGLRARESMMIKVGEKDLAGDKLDLYKGDGMKNGRPREIAPINGLVAARAAQEYVHSSDNHTRNSLIPDDIKYSQYQDWAYKQMGKICGELGYGRSFHSIRHGYAQTRYSQLWESRTGVAIRCPVSVGVYEGDWRRYAALETGYSLKEIVSLDHQIRLELSHDLGHGRVSVTSQYLGR